MEQAHARHNEIVHAAIQAHSGFVFNIVGDAFNTAFHNAADGLKAALEVQSGLQAESWGETGPIKVRIGLHTGAAESCEDGGRADYIGYSTLAATQRVMSAAHGGQVLLTQTVYDLVKSHLPEQIRLQDLGEHRLKDLREPVHIYQAATPNLPQDFPPVQSMDAHPNNLPVQLTTFVGREKEVEEVQAILDTARLVTLTGPGGTGKSRLSCEVGNMELAKFPHGAWLVELAPLSDPSQIITALAQVFNLNELPMRPLNSILLDYLREKKLLLILDNCEHLIEACARLADDLLHQCTGLKILASSREALGIAGEVAYRTPSLASSDAARLFVERARAVNVNFQRSASSDAAIAQICSRLDGIPLAIELAAARVKLLTPEQIATRLDDRFRLLVGGSRTALPRQQTLRALIDWSYDLLSEDEKYLLQFASVFAGGWTLEALEAVAGDPNTIENLEQLVNKSLVMTEERTMEMRYSMLETIRQYAREKLFESRQAVTARDRHFAYYLEFSEEIWEKLRATVIVDVVDQSKDEVDNLRTAIEWGLENHVEETVRLAANFCLVSSFHGLLAEGLTWAITAVERLKSLPAVEGDAQVRRQKYIARALFSQGMIGMAIGNLPLVHQVLQEAIAISRQTGDLLILGYSLETYYTATSFLHASDQEAAAREGLEIFSHQVDDRFGLGMAYLNMARIAANKGDQEEKRFYFSKLKEIIRYIPGSFQVGMFYLGMGIDESLHGDLAAAKKIFEDGSKIFEGIRNINFQNVLKSEIAHIERRTGNLEQARSIYEDTIQGWQELGNRSAIAHELECFGLLELAGKEPKRAVLLISAASALREQIESPMTDFERIEFEQSIAQLRAMLPEAVFEETWTEGQSLSMEQAIQLALGR